MVAKFKVVDLFAGPGGLAEGFSSIRDAVGQRVFDVTLSVEKEASAHRTLRLRSFVRQFDIPPASYYDYVDGKISFAALTSTHPAEWKAAIDEARRCCQSNRYKSPFGGAGAKSTIHQATSDCHSASAAERRIL